jgi:hypothetical protein
MIIVAVVPMIVAMVTVPWHSQHTPDAADDATSHTTDHATNHPANRTGRTSPNRSASLTALNNALGLRSKRQSKKSEDAGNHHKTDFHGQLSIIQHSPDELCDGVDDNRGRGSRLCRGQFRRRRLAFAVAGPCHGRKAAATAVAPVRPEVKILVERLSARRFSAAMR